MGEGEGNQRLREEEVERDDEDSAKPRNSSTTLQRWLKS